jgi:trk system potassium uptake protein TrkH
MFTGACLGSTSGALRLGRLILLGKLVTHRLCRIVYPRQVEILMMDELPVESDTIPYITNYFVLYLGIAGAASLLLTLCELDLVTSVSAVAALPVLAKLLLIGCMLVGRLDLYTPLVVCLPTFWRP